MLFLLVLVGVAIWGGLKIDRKRDVPHYPPGYLAVHGVAVGTGVVAQVPDKPVKPNVRPPPRNNQPGSGGSGGAPRAGGEIRISKADLTLQPVTPKSTLSVTQGEEQEFGLLKIKKDGELRWRGFAVGSFEMVGTLCAEAARNDKFLLVIAPDHETPWKYVYWAMEAARKNGLYNVGLGVTPIYSANPKRDLLAMLKAAQPREPYVENLDAPELRVLVEVERNGGVSYNVYDQVAESTNDLMRHLGGFNTEYAEMVDANYSRDPSKTPWVVVASPDTPTGAVLRCMDAIRQTAIYTVRFGGEFPDPPK